MTFSMKIFSSENAEDSGVVSVFFLFGILLLGSVLIFFHQFQWKFNIFRYLPYTVMVFILGLAIGVLSGTVIDDNIIIDSINYSPSTIPCARSSSKTYPTLRKSLSHIITPSERQR